MDLYCGPTHLLDPASLLRVGRVKWTKGSFPDLRTSQIRLESHLHEMQLDRKTGSSPVQINFFSDHSRETFVLQACLSHSRAMLRNSKAIDAAFYRKPVRSLPCGLTSEPLHKY